MEEILKEYNLIIKNKISLGNFNSAIASIQKLLGYAPKTDFGYYYLGVCNFALEKYKQSITDYAQAIKLNPTNAKAYFNLGVSYYMLKYNDYALINIGKALFLFSKAKELDKKERCIEALRLIESDNELGI